jgi:AraC-like DNA-binding protein
MATKKSRMEKIVNLDSISECNAFNNHKTLHPLATVIDFSKANPRDWGNADTVRFNYGLYSIFLKDVKCGDMVYGRHYYDYQAGTLVFFGPGQSAVIKNEGIRQPMGHGLFFHPDFLKDTSLGRTMLDYKFFSYQTHEALHISDDERQMILDCFAKVEYELKQPIDKHSKKLIATNIELFLNYCQRFYDRQFITRETAHRGIIARFEELVDTYFTTDKPHTIGLPSVAYFAEMLQLSANYFGDIIRKETGHSAKEYIQQKTIEVARHKLMENDKSVNEIAYDMGFKYPQHFTRLFKKMVGQSPLEYRVKNG